jgi:hypothetical protein
VKHRLASFARFAGFFIAILGMGLSAAGLVTAFGKSNEGGIALWAVTFLIALASWLALVRRSREAR